MDIRPIRTEADYRAALAEIDRLMDAAPGTPEGDRLDVLATLVEAYEARHHPVPAPDAVSAIVEYMERHGLGQADLAAVLGSASRASEVLNGRRGLSLRMIRALHSEWGLPAECLIGADEERERA